MSIKCIEALSMEILTKILETTSFVDIRSFMQTNWHNETQTTLYHKHILVWEIAKRGVNPSQNFQIMKSTGCIITGSIPLSLMFPQESSLPHKHITMMVGSDSQDDLLNLLHEWCDFNVNQVKRRPMWANIRDPNLTEGIFTLTRIFHDNHHGFSNQPSHSTNVWKWSHSWHELCLTLQINMCLSFTHTFTTFFSQSAWISTPHTFIAFALQERRLQYRQSYLDLEGLWWSWMQRSWQLSFHGAVHHR